MYGGFGLIVLVFIFKRSISCELRDYLGTNSSIKRGRACPKNKYLEGQNMNDVSFRLSTQMHTNTNGKQSTTAAV